MGGGRAAGKPVTERVRSSGELRKALGTASGGKLRPYGAETDVARGGRVCRKGLGRGRPLRRAALARPWG